MKLIFLFVLFVCCAIRPANAQTLPANYSVTNNVPYVTGGLSRQWMDLYYVPSNAAPTPVVIWIHGGGWTSGNESNPRALALTNFNVAVASITHRYTTNTQPSPYPASLPHPTQIQDVKSAIRWLRANAAQYNIDPNRIGIWGFSSGGHLSALAGTSGHTNIFDVGEHLGQSSRVQAVVDMSGPTDLLQAPTVVAGQNYDFWLLGDNAVNNPPTLATVNPINFVQPDAPPFRIIHGQTDPNVPILASQLLHTALTNAGVSSTFISLSGTGHTIPANQDAPAALWLAETLNAVGTTSLVVNNHSFELPIIQPGAFSATSAPTGWSAYGNALNFSSRTIGVLRPAPPTLYVEPAPDGNNVGVTFLLDNQANQTQFANIEAGMQQTLTATLQPLRRYTLRVEVGNIANSASAPFQFGGFPNYRIDLMAGTNVIASDLNSLLPGEGRFLTSTITVATAASNPFVGQPLGIRLVNLNNAPGIEVNFDNVRLDSTPVLPPMVSFAHVLPPGSSQLTWPDPGGNIFAVETSTNLTNWTPQPGTPQLNAGIWSLTIPTPTSGRSFYRLRSL